MIPVYVAKKIMAGLSEEDAMHLCLDLLEYKGLAFEQLQEAHAKREKEK